MHHKYLINDSHIGKQIKTTNIYSFREKNPLSSQPQLYFRPFSFPLPGLHSPCYHGRWHSVPLGRWLALHSRLSQPVSASHSSAAPSFFVFPPLHLVSPWAAVPSRVHLLQHRLTCGPRFLCCGASPSALAFCFPLVPLSSFFPYFCPFLNTFSPRCHQVGWWLHPHPAVGRPRSWLGPAVLSTGQLLALSHRGHPWSPPLPKPCHGHPI